MRCIVWNAVVVGFAISFLAGPWSIKLLGRVQCPRALIGCMYMYTVQFETDFFGFSDYLCVPPTS